MFVVVNKALVIYPVVFLAENQPIHPNKCTICMHVATVECIRHHVHSIIGYVIGEHTVGFFFVIRCHQKMANQIIVVTKICANARMQVAIS